MSLPLLNMQQTPRESPWSHHEWWWPWVVTLLSSRTPTSPTFALERSMFWWRTHSGEHSTARLLQTNRGNTRVLSPPLETRKLGLTLRLPTQVGWCHTTALHQRLNLHLSLSNHFLNYVNLQNELDFPINLWPLLSYTDSLHFFRGHCEEAKRCLPRGHLPSSVSEPIQYFQREEIRFQGTTEKHRAILPASV